MRKAALLLGLVATVLFADWMGYFPNQFVSDALREATIIVFLLGLVVLLLSFIVAKTPLFLLLLLLGLAIYTLSQSPLWFYVGFDRSQTDKLIVQQESTDAETFELIGEVK